MYCVLCVCVVCVWSVGWGFNLLSASVSFYWSWDNHLIYIIPLCLFVGVTDDNNLFRRLSLSQSSYWPFYSINDSENLCLLKRDSSIDSTCKKALSFKLRRLHCTLSMQVHWSTTSAATRTWSKSTAFCLRPKAFSGRHFNPNCDLSPRPNQDREFCKKALS